MDFFIIENGLQVGPLTINQLAEKKIKPKTLVWREGMPDWQPAWKVNELRYILDEINMQEHRNSQGASIVPPIPESYQQNNNAPEDNLRPNLSEEKKRKSKLPLMILGGVIFLVFAILVASNPDKETHENAIRTEISKAIDKASSSSDNDMFSHGIKMVVRMMAGSFMDSALNQLFEYHNYLIFSKGTITIEGKEHTISYGIFSKVITMNADDMLKALEDDKEEKSSINNMDEVNDSENYSSSENSLGNSNSDNSGDEEVDGAGEDFQSKLEQKANKAVDRIVDHASKKVEDKINKKLDEVSADSSTIEKLVDKILDLF